MDFQSLSDRQRAILKFIEHWSDEHGFPPTIREIGAAVGIGSTSVVNYNLNKLMREGFISRSKDVSRGIRLMNEGEPKTKRPRGNANVLLVPMVGQIVAGQPAPHPGDDFGYYYDEESGLPIPRAFIGNTDPAEVYALTVNGLSMIDAMINDGDVVILKRQAVARNGEMVAVWLNERGETTLKHFFDEGKQVRLQPANPTMSPIYVDKDKVEIQGRVLAVMRRVN
jgi:repressor LexA